MSRIAAVLVAAAVFAPSILATTPLAAQMQHDAMRPAKADTPADRAFLGAMQEMMVGMHEAPPTGDTDKDFVTMMVPHHKAAVDMAKAELEYGKDPALKTLAKSIVAAQEKEIAMMKSWAETHGK